MVKLIITTPVYRSEAAIVPECRATVNALRDAGLALPEWLIQPGPLVFDNRNRLIRQAMKLPDWTHLLFIDADVSLEYPVSDVTALLSHGKDIVGGAYQMRDDIWSPVVCAARLDRGHVGMGSTGLHLVDWTGGGCLLISRAALEALRPLWFQHITTADGAGQTPEDVGFCQHARTKGYSIWLDCDVHAMHHQLPDNPGTTRAERRRLARTESGTQQAQHGQKGCGGMLSLNGMELLSLPKLLPANGTIMDQIASKGIREKSLLTEADLLSIEFHQEGVDGGSRIVFNATKATALVREVSFTANELDLLKARVSEMDTKKLITPQILDVALKIRDASKEQG